MLEEPIRVPTLNPQMDLTVLPYTSVATPSKSKCVCEICTCGMHHCPRPRLKGIFETTYKHDYRGYKPKPKAYPFSPPEYKMRHYDKESLETSYDEYNRAGELIREKIESRRLCSHKGNRTVFEDAGKSLLRNHLRMVGVSEYKDHYKSPPKRERSLREGLYHERVCLPRVKFEGESCYKHDYLPYLRNPAKVKSLEDIRVQILSSPSKAEKDSLTKHDSLQKLISEDRERMKTLPSLPQRPSLPAIISAKCPCELIQIPTANNTDHLHLKYDSGKGEWL